MLVLVFCKKNFGVDVDFVFSLWQVIVGRFYILCSSVQVGIVLFLYFLKELKIMIMFKVFLYLNNNFSFIVCEIYKVRIG